MSDSYLNTTFQSTQQSEIWKPVVGWETVYHVSNLGRIKRISSGNLPMSRAKIGRILKSVDIDGKGNGGYIGVTLSLGKRRQRKLVHQIVMLAFVGEPPANYQVNHKNGIKTDCRLSNLEYLTRSENVKHRFHVLGHQSPLLGEKSWNAKLTEQKVINIRRRYALGGITKDQLAKEHGVTENMIYLIVTRRSWKHIP